MAQLGGAQREPSMEEILASIRRIIEDSDTVRRSDDAAGPVRPDNDVAPSAATAAVAESTVIEVETFRAPPRVEAPAAEPRGPVTMAEVQAQVVAERAAARDLPEFGHSPAEASAHEPPHDSADLEPVAGEPEMATAVEEPAAASTMEWRLGVPEEQAVETVEHDDFDVDEVAKAVLEDISSAQSAVPRAEDWLPEEADQAAEAPRPAIISDQTGKQVAAAFHELSEALAARNRKSLDEMAEEMLRPMLQDWLDNNLPTLVERLVREEIERVARGAN
ncbi:DUF2497 domain-containing protein [Mesorhizobium sp. LHD-90]|uniref:PopZ family protein n=1 Tax=Mesorhizobium sp. LHD-90 TaxID=3071414 RepID=UPI0027E0DF2A|nr:DUF2497 domain-containing protein [Mesorhizobium sp. LHD-90]MDQ6437911.1 DUF2497 domain-containing protein [Mesorhizobium sp. LHD-90]